MTSFIVLLALIPVLLLLIDYARHDHFAGAPNVHRNYDDLGSVADREHLSSH